MKKMFTAIAIMVMLGMMLSITVLGMEDLEHLTVNVIGLGVDEIPDVQPQYISTCPGGAKHQMYGKGLGHAYYGYEGNAELRISGGATTQCSYCDLVLITENNPYITGAVWGDYALWNPGYQISSGVTRMYTYDFGNSTNNNDDFVKGFNFAK